MFEAALVIRAQGSPHHAAPVLWARDRGGLRPHRTTASASQEPGRGADHLADHVEAVQAPVESQTVLVALRICR